jgi:hypothetical protein
MNDPRQLKSTSIPTRWKSNWSLRTIIASTPPNAPSALSRNTLLLPSQPSTCFACSNFGTSFCHKLNSRSTCYVSLVTIPLFQPTTNYTAHLISTRRLLLSLAQRPWFATTPPLTPPGHPMLLMVSMYAPQSITTDVSVFTSHRPGVSVSLTLGNSIPPIAKSPSYPRTTKTASARRHIQTTWWYHTHYSKC